MGGKGGWRWREEGIEVISWEEVQEEGVKGEMRCYEEEEEEKEEREREEVM